MLRILVTVIFRSVLLLALYAFKKALLKHKFVTPNDPIATNKLDFCHTFRVQKCLITECFHSPLGVNVKFNSHCSILSENTEQNKKTASHLAMVLLSSAQ